jgi:transcriptional regulator with XRE-family HTH domain
MFTLATSVKQPVTREVLLRAFTLCLKRLRSRAGIAQETLAYHAGIDRAYMGGLERGKHMPSLETIYKICDAFGIPFVIFAAHFEDSVRLAKRKKKSEDASE